MSTYVISDIHGSWTALQAILERAKFDPDRDHLIVLGDFIGRGIHSLEILTFLRQLGKNKTILLGNHEIMLLQIFYGTRRLNPNNRFEPILDHPKVEEWIEWLCHQNFFHYHEEFKIVGVHAGIYPTWNIEESVKRNDQLRKVFQDQKKRYQLLEQIKRNSAIISELPVPTQLATPLLDEEFSLAVFTRMRYLTDSGGLDFTTAVTPRESPEHLTPWYIKYQKEHPEQIVYFGHWASLTETGGQKWCQTLDKGYIWGLALMMRRLDDGKDFFFWHGE